MGVLSEQEVRTVEGYLAQFPELQKDFFEIQNALQALATERSLKPRATLEDELIKSIMGDAKPPIDNKQRDNKEHKNGRANLWKIISGILAVGAISALYFFWNLDTQYKAQSQEFNTYKLECDSIARSQQAALDLFNELNEKENNVLNMTPTPDYPETQLLFHFNPTTRRNHIQIQNLPEIAANQAFQLWSLKPGEDPIPLTVFKNSNMIIVPVDFEEGTGTYAITIEDEAGALAPTLTRLIGTVGV